MYFCLVYQEIIQNHGLSLPLNIYEKIFLLNKKKKSNIANTNIMMNEYLTFNERKYEYTVYGCSLKYDLMGHCYLFFVLFDMCFLMYCVISLSTINQFQYVTSIEFKIKVLRSDLHTHSHSDMNLFGKAIEKKHFHLFSIFFCN